MNKTGDHPIGEARRRIGLHDDDRNAPQYSSHHDRPGHVSPRPQHGIGLHGAQEPPRLDYRSGVTQPGFTRAQRVASWQW